ncbi:ParB/RepB/Spo0J family partition protein [Paracoccaceae bacterium GXU_MW_L88]
MSGSNEKRGLGRGLSALLADAEYEESEPTTSADSHIAIDLIRPNPDQPRKSFRQEDLENLASSIRRKGVIQPLIVRKDPESPRVYQIVAGERRWRAAQMARLHEVPVVIRNLSEAEVLEIAIIENVQRSDLNPIEEALGYRQLLEKFSHTQERLAEVIGKSRSHIANSLRLLTLPEPVQALVVSGGLSAGHARALITSENAAELAQKVVKGDLSVRETEKLVRAEKEPKADSKEKLTGKDSDTKALEGDLAAHLRMKVDIRHNQAKETGELRISYKNLEELEALCQLLSR